ncbi:helix-turn-helix transcriptional regulator [Paractinoplanes rhizophilus]|uniref:Helix-turn-helix transcriptional regulator n=1 Tax=Paractinoplanes rhizophilus TaxID=1416877 RepID=A0ABW2HIQ8_9ACTN
MARQPYIPRIQHRLLVARLKQLREDHNLSPTELAAKSKINATQISRLESLTRPPVPSQVVALCRFYKLDERTTSELEALAAPVKGDNDSWSRYDLETGTAKYLTFESEAKSVATFQAQLIPGLLQTELYATAVVSSLRRYFSADQISQTVSARMERRKNLTPPRSLEFRAVMDEPVINRVLGGVKGMQQQLRHLLAAGDLPNVTVQILPMDVGPHPGLDGSFSIFTFGQALLDDFVYVEDQVGQAFDDQEDIVRRCKEKFELLSKLAAPEDESRAIIERRLDALARKS